RSVPATLKVARTLRGRDAGPRSVPATLAAPYLFLPLLRFPLLDVELRVLVEGVTAAGAANVIGGALEADGAGAQTAADDALLLLLACAEAGAFHAVGDLVIL